MPLKALLLSFLSVQPVFGQIDFFQNGIDYWNEHKETPKPTEPIETKSESTQKSQVENKTSESFDWKPYLDPKKPEFFKEGDYTPPAPFMEIVRNPSDENLKKWFSYIEKRNELSSRLQQRMNDYLGTLNSPIKEVVQQRMAALPVESEEQKRFRFRFYFDSSCPHCKKMFNTMAELQNRGFLVEARQIDRGPVDHLPLPTTLASPDELKKQNIQSVPYLLIGDLKNQSVYTLTGYQSVESVLEALRQRRSL